MNAGPPGWEHSEVTDGARHGTVSEVLTRRRPRATASGVPSLPTQASQSEAIGAQNLVAGCDTSELSHNSDPSETAVFLLVRTRVAGHSQNAL